MQEHAATIAGTRHVLEEPFMVLATENPLVFLALRVALTADQELFEQEFLDTLNGG